MLFMLIDNNKERVYRNFNYFNEQADTVMIPVNSADKFNKFLCIADAVIVYYSEGTDIDEFTKLYKTNSIKTYIVFAEENANNTLFSYYIDAESVVGEYETAKLYLYLKKSGQKSISSAKRHLKRVDEVFGRLSLPFHLQGVEYLKSAVKLCLDEPEMLQSITKCLYPALAAKYNTNFAAVEHAIRNAIEHIWRENKKYLSENLLLKNGTRPTNKAFIHALIRNMDDNL